MEIIMRKSTQTHLVKLSLASLLTITPLLTTASPTEQDERAVSGTIVCGGNHLNRQGNTESQRTAYVWRNYNTDLSINIDRFTIYDATGATLVDFNATTLPNSFNSVMGNGDNTIEPFQTVLYRTNELLGSASLPRENRPIQVRIEWSADSRALIPEMVWVRGARGQSQRPDGSFRSLEDRARHLNNCRSIEINKGHSRENKDKHKDD